MVHSSWCIASLHRHRFISSQAGESEAARRGRHGGRRGGGTARARGARQPARRGALLRAPPGCPGHRDVARLGAGQAQTRRARAARIVDSKVVATGRAGRPPQRWGAAAGSGGRQRWRRRWWGKWGRGGGGWWRGGRGGGWWRRGRGGGAGGGGGGGDGGGGREGCGGDAVGRARHTPKGRRWRRPWRWRAIAGRAAARECGVGCTAGGGESAAAAVGARGAARGQRWRRWRLWHRW